MADFECFDGMAGIKDGSNRRIRQIKLHLPMQNVEVLVSIYEDEFWITEADVREHGSPVWSPIEHVGGEMELTYLDNDQMTRLPWSEWEEQRHGQ